MAKRKSGFRRPTADEQTVLREMHLKLLVAPKDIQKCDQILIQEHYLHHAQLVGEQLRYGVFWKGQWLAVATWSAPALHLKARDGFIGWTEEQRRQRLPLVVNNSRLYVLAPHHYPNLVSRFMKLMLGRLSADWESTWGHPVVLAESFVDPQQYRGTAYQVSGWSQLGHTRGWKRSAVDFYEEHGHPKQVWIRELVRNACAKLRAAELPAAWALGLNPVPPPLHRQSQGDCQPDGAVAPNDPRVPAQAGLGLSDCRYAGAHRHGDLQRCGPRLRRPGRLRRHAFPSSVAGAQIPQNFLGG